MAKQKSFLKIDGTLGGLTFYKSGDEYLIKTKSEVSKDKIDNSPNFQRTRENNEEFGMSTKAAKLLRLGLRNVLKNASDKYVVSRLVKQMMLVRKYDFTSNRGMRSVAVGIQDPLAKRLLVDFDFNINAPLRSVLFSPYVLDEVGGSLSFAGFKPIDDLSFPEGATHVSLRFLSCDVSFADDLVVVESSVSQNLLLDGANTPFSLNVAMNASIGTRFFILFVEFFQQVNGVQYSLRNGAFNVLNVLSVV